MTDGYDCYQNALAERVNGILKGELLLQSPQDLAQAREMVREAVDIYNLERPYHALKYRTPDAVHWSSECQKLTENVQTYFRTSHIENGYEGTSHHDNFLSGQTIAMKINVEGKMERMNSR